MIQPILDLLSACALWVCDPFGKHAIYAGDEAISKALFVWASHQQMAPHSNSSLSESLQSFVTDHPSLHHISPLFIQST